MLGDLAKEGVDEVHAPSAGLVKGVQVLLEVCNWIGEVAKTEEGEGEKEKEKKRRMMRGGGGD